LKALFFGLNVKGMKMVFLDILGPALVTFTSGAVGWLFGRRKEKAETASNELNNTEKAITIWREMAHEMSAKVNELSDKVDLLTKEVHSLRAENADLKQKLGLNKNLTSR
jgi:peptidoglycan hydrolase CwlO-like protein